MPETSLCFKDTITAILIGVAIFFVYKWLVAEKFSSEELMVTPELNMKAEELQVAVPAVNQDTQTIMAGSGFIAPKEIAPAWGSNYGMVDGLDDGAGGNMGFHYNLCSPSCCSDQYPTPHKLPFDEAVCGQKGEFVPTNLQCNNAWNNSGCLCVKKTQFEHLVNRGGNA
jgi:hypothetical protein